MIKFSTGIIKVGLRGLHILTLGLCACAPSVSGDAMAWDQGQVRERARVSAELMSKFKASPTNEGGNESLVLDSVWVQIRGRMDWVPDAKIFYLLCLLERYGPLTVDDVRKLKEQITETDRMDFERRLLFYVKNEKWEEEWANEFPAKTGLLLAQVLAGLVRE